MAINETGIVYIIISNLSAYVWGNEIITSITIVVFFTIISILLQIPLPFALALQIPFIIVLTAWGFLPIVVGGIMTVAFLVLAIGSFLMKLN